MTDMFTPGRIGRVEVNNRLVRSATWEALGDAEGLVTEPLIAMIERLAHGGVGHIILGLTAVSALGKGMAGMTSLATDRHVAGHARLGDAVHRAGARISIQLAHTGAQSNPAVLGAAPVAPSAVHHPAFDVTPRALTTAEVKAVIDDYGQAAARAARAGYDLIQIHGAHGYLAGQFMSPRFNRRDDEYAEPGRFTMEVYRAVRAAAPGLAVHIKLNLDDFLEGSTTPAVALPIARALAAAGIDAIEVSGGTPASGNLKASRTGVLRPDQEAYMLDLARMVKKEVGCPVIGVGGWRSPAVIDRALGAGEVDYVSMSRPFIREPGLPRRWAGGDLRPATCISCNGCFKAVKLGGGIACWVELEKQGKV